MSTARLHTWLTHLAEVASGSQVVFGSSEHEWRMKPPLSTAALKTLEKSLGVLPDDVRAWLTTVASAGAGPGYGLVKLVKPKGGAPSERFTTAKKKGAPLNGCVVLGTEGADIHSVLVLAGPKRGEVWSVFDNGLRRAQAPSFTQFIEQWLTHASIEWASSRLFAALLKEKRPAIVDDVRALIRADGSLAGLVGESAQITLSGLHAAAGDIDKALVAADAAALTFKDANADQSDPEDRAEQDIERAARRALYRARAFRLVGDKARARAALAEAPAASKSMWASTRDELAAERTAVR